MKIYSWNVNGLRAISKKGFKHWFQSHPWSIICLQEVKAFEHQLDQELLPQNYSYWHNGQVKGYAGVTVFSKKQAKILNYDFHSDLGPFKNDGRILALEFSSFILLNIYFPNGAPKLGVPMLPHKLKFYQTFLDYINTLKKNGKSIIACGDFNIAHTELDIARPVENQNSIGFLPIERKQIDQIIQSKYIDVFRYFHQKIPHQYTWWSYQTRARERNVGWRIDYFFVSYDLLPKIRNVQQLAHVTGSDHCPISIDINI